MGNAVSIRIGWVKSTAAGGAIAHAYRAKTPSYVNTNRTHENLVISGSLNPPDALKIRSDIEAYSLKNAGRKWQKNSATLMDGIISYGRDADLVDKSALDNAALLTLRKITAKAGLRKDAIVYLIRHEDESRTHYHFSMLPQLDSGVSARRSFGRSFMSKLQDIAAESHQECNLNIRRGKSKNQRKKDGEPLSATVHRSVKELHHDLPREIASLESSETSLNRILDDLQAQLQSKQEELSTIDSTLLERNLTLEQTEGRLETAQEKYELILNDETASSKNIENLAKRVADYEARILKQTQEITFLNNGKTELEQQLEPLREEKTNLEQQLEPLRTEKSNLEQQLEPLRTEKSNLEQQLEPLRTEKSNLEQQLEPLRTEKNNLEKAISNIPKNQFKTVPVLVKHTKKLVGHDEVIVKKQKFVSLKQHAHTRENLKKASISNKKLHDERKKLIGIICLNHNFVYNINQPLGDLETYENYGCEILDFGRILLARNGTDKQIAAALYHQSFSAKSKGWQKATFSCTQEIAQEIIKFAGNDGKLDCIEFKSPECTSMLVRKIEQERIEKIQQSEPAAPSATTNSMSKFFKHVHAPEPEPESESDLDDDMGM